MREIILVVHNVRSAHNVGSLMRSAEGLGVNKIYLSGYTPYPPAKNDNRLPHLRQKLARQIHKTALGAEFFVNWEYQPDVSLLIRQLRVEGYSLLALEQTPAAVSINRIKGGRRLALFVGNEVSGLEPMVLKQVKKHIQIPMSGRKESFNVAVAAAIALYRLRYMDKAIT